MKNLKALKNTIRRVSLSIVTLVLLCTTSLHAADPISDSLLLCNSENWTETELAPGVIYRELTASRTSTLFDTMQRLFVVEIDPTRYRLQLVAPQQRQRVSQMVRKVNPDAVAAINGGFFVTGIREAIAADFLKIDDVPRSVIPTTGWGTGLVATAADNSTHITPWDKSMEQPEAPCQKAFPNMMVAGPLLVRGGTRLLAVAPTVKYALSSEQEHDIYAPRSAIGLRHDGTIVLVVVDGRRRNSYGMSLGELSVVGVWLGLSGMLNLDGGGSSTMWIRDRGVANAPSDGIGLLHLERKVANALLVIPL